MHQLHDCDQRLSAWHARFLLQSIRCALEDTAGEEEVGYLGHILIKQSISNTCPSPNAVHNVELRQDLQTAKQSFHVQGRNEHEC